VLLLLTTDSHTSTPSAITIPNLLKDIAFLQNPYIARLGFTTIANGSDTQKVRSALKGTLIFNQVLISRLGATDCLS
jgi:hypothetical protein